VRKPARPASIGVVIGALVAGLVLLCAPQAPAKDPDIRVLCSNGIKAAMEALIPEAERATGRTIVIQFSSSAVLKRSIDGGEPFDLAILTPGIVDDLIKAGKIQAGTHADLASAALAVGVRAGAPRADVGTPEAMKRTLLAARSITYTKEGAASAAIANMLRSLGVQDQLASRTTLQTVPGRAAETVATGEHELVFAPVSEIMPVHGVDVLGLFPKPFQAPVVMTAGVAAGARDPDGARALIKFMTSSKAAPAIKASGMEPVPGRPSTSS
jgi:molybdate transport system substrate-binding protein